MGNRYSDIKKGGELKIALDNYVDYLTNPANRTTKRVTGGSYGGTKGAMIRIGIRPFGVPVAAGFYVINQVRAEALTTTGANFDGIADFGSGTDKRFEKTIDVTNIVAAPEGYVPARVSAFKGVGAPTYKQSKVTKLYYLHYPGKTWSCPFGRLMTALGDNELEQTVYNSVKEAVLAEATITRVSIRDQVLKPST